MKKMKNYSLVFRKMASGVALLGLIWVIVGLPASLRAQSTALLTGMVVDPSGSVVPGAQVLCQDTGTGTTYTTTTNAQGLFRFPDLPIGNYQLVVTRAGFEQLVRNGITLITAHSVDVTLQLKVGQARQSVQVTAATPVVQPTASVIQTSIESRSMRELPLNGRNPLQLVILTPGSLTSRTGTEGNQQENTGIVTNGLRALDDNYVLDGVRFINREWDGAPILPNPDALQEFTVQSSNYSAKESGAGASILLSTRAGTNEFHGSAFEFLRNNGLDARNFFASSVTPFKRNQYGGTFGGPIRHDKSFIFVAYQGTRVRGSANPALSTVPNSAMRGGDFSSLGKTIIDPQTGKAFPGSKIPSTLFSPLSLKLLPYVPLPNLPNNRVAERPSANQNDDQFVVRFDHNFSSKDHFTARYFFDEFDFQRATSNFTDIYAENDYRDQNFMASDAHSFSPNLLFQAAFGFTRTARTQVPTEPTTLQALGQKVPEALASAAPELRVNVNGYFNLFSGGGLLGRPETFEEHGNFTWMHNKHMLQFGLDVYRDLMYSADTSFASGTNTFNGSRTSSTTIHGSGDAFADFLVGLPNAFSQGGRTPQNFRETDWQPWIQDDWRVLPHFTLNLGLRWEPWLPAYDLLGPATGFVPGVQSVAATFAPTGLLFTGDPGLRNSIFPNDWRNFGPRVGFAWDVKGNQKTVVRSAYGIFYMSVPLNLYRTANSGSAFRSLSTDIPDPPSFDDPYANFPGGSPFPFKPPANNELKTYQFVKPVVTSTLDPGSRTGYTQEWNFTLERQLMPNLGISVAYVGNHTVDVMATRQGNPAVYGPGATVANTNSRRIFAKVGLGPLAIAAPWEYSNYNGLQVSVTKRTTQGLTIVANYTYSKCLDNESGQTIGADAGGGSGTNPFNLNAYYGPCDYDIRHDAKVAFVYDLPRVSSFQGAADRLVNGWQVTSIFTAHSAEPFNVMSGRDNSLSGEGQDHADQVGNPARPSGVTMLQEFFNTQAFTENVLGTFGTSGRNILYGPGSWGEDFGLFKWIPLTERVRMQFRFEAFNLFNHARFNNPNATVTNPNYGKILGAQDPRVLQFALKLAF